MLYMYHSFLIHSSADGHLGCFHVLAMINSAAMNIGVHVSLSDLVSLHTKISILAWRVPWTEKAGVLQFVWSQKSQTWLGMHAFPFLPPNLNQS